MNGIRASLVVVLALVLSLGAASETGARLCAPAGQSHAMHMLRATPVATMGVEAISLDPATKHKTCRDGNCVGCAIFTAAVADAFLTPEIAEKSIMSTHCMTGNMRQPPVGPPRILA